MGKVRSDPHCVGRLVAVEPRKACEHGVHVLGPCRGQPSPGSRAEGGLSQTQTDPREAPFEDTEFSSAPWPSRDRREFLPRPQHLAASWCLASQPPPSPDSEWLLLGPPSIREQRSLLFPTSHSHGWGSPTSWAPDRALGPREPPCRPRIKSQDPGQLNETPHCPPWAPVSQPRPLLEGAQPARVLAGGEC